MKTRNPNEKDGEKEYKRERRRHGIQTKKMEKRSIKGKDEEKE